MKKKAVITMMDIRKDYAEEKRILNQLGLDAEHISLEATDDTRTIIDRVKGCDFVLAGPELWNREAMDGVRDTLKMIVRLGTGMDRVDIDAATEYGIAVCNTPGANSISVAQHALALMLDLSMSITKYDRGMRNGSWETVLAHDLIGKTVGLLGFGRIAGELAGLLGGFRTRILYYDVIKNEEKAAALGAQYAELDELVRQSDYISLHMPLNHQTEGMVNIDFLRKMKPTAYLINTSRGKVVNEKDLVKALDEGLIAGAGLDVFENQPLSPSSPLLKMENVVLTPYAAFCSHLGIEQTMEMAIGCISDFCSGKEIRNLLNPEYINHVR